MQRISTTSRRVVNAYGLRCATEADLLGWVANVDAGADGGVDVSVVERGALDDRWTASARRIWETRSSHGRPFVLDQCEDGSWRMEWGEGDRFHLSADRRKLISAPRWSADAGWQRELLDTVLVCTSLLGGQVALHASSAEYEPGHAVALLGPSGAGKSTLLAALLATGRPFVTDDMLVVRANATVCSGPPVLNAPLESLEMLSGSSVELARFDTEVLMLVDAPAADAAALSAIVLLRRSRGAKLATHRVTPSVFDLLPHTAALNATDEQRLEIASRLVEEARMYVLEADVAEAPGRMSQAILEAVRG